MKFKVDDIVQIGTDGAKYRIHAILEKPNRYKMYCLTNGTIHEFSEWQEEAWNLTTAPTCETLYQVGQILIKIVGTPRIALVLEISKISKEKDFNQYKIQTFTPTGESITIFSISEKEMKKEWVTRDLKWVVLYGNPKKILQTYFEKLIALYQEQKRTAEDLLERLEFFRPHD